MEKRRSPLPAAALECPFGKEEHEIRCREYTENLREERR